MRVDQYYIIVKRRFVHDLYEVISNNYNLEKLMYCVVQFTGILLVYNRYVLNRKYMYSYSNGKQYKNVYFICG